MTICSSCGVKIPDGEPLCEACGLASLATDKKNVVKNLINTPSTEPPDRFGTGELLPQQILREHYYIIEKVAQGGMSTVYKAMDVRMDGKAVALKELPEAGLAAEGRQAILDAFTHEAELLAQLNHPNLVKVTDHFQDGLYHYMAMEYVEGRTLAQLIDGAQRPFPEGRVMVWAEQLCDALHYLHTQEPVVIYRDLKPGNIMVNEQTDQVKLIDFGIARFYEPSKSKDTMAFGTEGYAPPEQYGSGQTDVRADVFALGITLHELLTLQDPGQHLTGLRNIRVVNQQVNPVIAHAIAKAVRQDRRFRYPTITEMWEAMSGKPARWANPEDKSFLNAPGGDRTEGNKGSQRTYNAPDWHAGVAVGSVKSVDFGEITKRSQPFQHNRKISIPPGEKLSVSTTDPWVHVHPAALNAAGGDLLITIDTQSLLPGKRIRTGGIFRGWISFHTARLIPESRTYRSHHQSRKQLCRYDADPPDGADNARWQACVCRLAGHRSDHAFELAVFMRLLLWVCQV